jgi:hypothetical protein
MNEEKSSEDTENRSRKSIFVQEEQNASKMADVQEIFAQEGKFHKNPIKN